MGLQPQKLRKISIFGIILPLMENFGVTVKVEYRCTTANLPLCNDTIIVLKIHCFIAFLLSQTFVIPKRDKQKKQIKTSHFFVYSQHATHNLNHTWHGDRGGPYHFCPPHLTFWIQSVVSPLEAIENLCENAPAEGKCL